MSHLPSDGILTHPDARESVFANADRRRHRRCDYHEDQVLPQQLHLHLTPGPDSRGGQAHSGGGGPHIGRRLGSRKHPSPQDVLTCATPLLADVNLTFSNNSGGQDESVEVLPFCGKMHSNRSLNVFLITVIIIVAVLLLWGRRTPNRRHSRRAELTRGLCCSEGGRSGIL